MYETAPVSARLSTGEFLVIVIILAIAAAIVIPPYTRAQDDDAARAIGAPVSGLGLRCADEVLVSTGDTTGGLPTGVDHMVLSQRLGKAAEFGAPRRT